MTKYLMQIHSDRLMQNEANSRTSRTEHEVPTMQRVSRSAARNRSSGRWPIVRRQKRALSGQWSNWEGTGDARKCKTKPNRNRPLVARTKRVNVYVFGNAYAKRSQFCRSASTPSQQACELVGAPGDIKKLRISRSSYEVVKGTLLNRGSGVFSVIILIVG